MGGVYVRTNRPVRLATSSPTPGDLGRPWLIPGSMVSVQRPGHDFDAIYASEKPPAWDIGRPQPAFKSLGEAGDLVGRVLDPGCGTGEHALLAASLGHEVVGIDLSARAIELAMTKATERGVKARFVVGDALRLVDLGERFDTVLDCGLFHVLDDDDRALYVDSLAVVVPLGGRYHMLCFSERQPGDWGPRRVTQTEIRTAFSEGWEVESIEPTVIDLTWDPAGALAWQVAVTRK
jgi:SAM-dependent methyltransferase